MSDRDLPAVVLQASGVTVQFGATRALDDVSLTCRRGATGLLGPNGAGKSTLIKVLLGLLPPTVGELTVLGRSVKGDVKRVRQQVGYMPEHDGYVPGLSGVQFVAYLGELSGLRRSEAMARAHEVLFYVGLGEARYRPIETYSTGMKQRVKLAQALVHDPALLFLDEPTNGLDPRGREEMLALIQDIAQRKNVSVLLSSHLLADVERSCQDVVVLNRGRVVTASPIGDLTLPHGRVFEVRIKGSAERFQTALETHALAVLDSDAGPEGASYTLESPNGEAEPIFAAARDSSAQVRHLLRKRPSLEEVFRTALAKPTAP